jgi:hypothetical protein
MMFGLASGLSGICSNDLTETANAIKRPRTPFIMTLNLYSTSNLSLQNGRCLYKQTMKYTIIDVLVRGGGAVPRFIRDGVMTDEDGSPFSHPQPT